MIATASINTAFDLIDEEIKKTLKLYPAVHEDQIDNIFDGGVTCAITSLSMLLQSYNLPEYGGAIRVHRQVEDDILRDIRANFPKYQAVGLKLGVGTEKEPPSEQYLRKDFRFLKWYAKQHYNVELVYSNCKKVTLNRLIDGIEAPFMMSTSDALTSSGHIILPRGRIVTGLGLSMIANDPNGVYPYRIKKSGEEVVYDMKMFPSTYKDKDGNIVENKYHMLSMGDYPKK